MRTIRRMLAKVKDPRASNTMYPIVEVLLIALAASLAGQTHCTDFEVFGRSKEEVFRRLVPLTNGIPSHDTFSTVLRRIEPAAFEALLRQLNRAIGLHGTRGEVIAIDGKSLRGAYGAGEQATPLHMVNAWACNARLVLAQRKSPRRNELAGALELLALLDLEGATVTADALHCTVAMATALLERKAHYVLALKKNRRTLYKLASELLERPGGGSRAQQQSAIAHGRSERRSAIVMPAAQLAAAYRFPGLVAVGRIVSWRRNGSGPTSRKEHYYLLSRKLSATQLLHIARAHWRIENNLHWVLDVTFAEDDCRSRNGHAPENLAALRRIALNIHQSSGHTGRLKHQVLQAAWDDRRLFELLSQMR